MEDSREFFRVTGRRVTFEYTLMAGVNDSQLQVRLGSSLATLAFVLWSNGILTGSSAYLGYEG